MAEDTAPLPRSIEAQPLEPGKWRCTFHYRPSETVQKVVLAGSFNTWDRQAIPMLGPDEHGEWTVQIELPTSTYEYKFLIDGEQWINDPINLDQVPDSFGGYNSLVRLGRLAQMKQSQAQLGDGRIDTLGLAHRPTTALYVQQLDEHTLSIRYRTFANDVQQVWLAIKDGDLIEMPMVSEGPLFAYREARIPIPATRDRMPNVHSLAYTFVLEDGTQRVGDPHTYHYSLTSSGLFTAPEWARHAVWYQVLLDRFRNGNPDNDPDPVHPWTSAWFEPAPWEEQGGQTFYDLYVFERFYGGDLDGLAAKLPYLKKLGVNALYLNPIFQAPSYHKYDLQDYRHIDDGFGVRGEYEQIIKREDLLDSSTWQWTASDKRFIEFLKQAHELGFKVVLDGVFNHVGSQHPAFVDVLKNKQNSPYADWFAVTSWDPFEYKGWADFAHMPVFCKNRSGFGSDAVRKHIFAVTRRWMDPNGDGDPSDGIDGWRLDVPNDVPRPFWTQWRKLVKEINPDAFITGEVWNRANQWLDGHHFDAVMNYEFARTAVKWIFDRQYKISASAAAARMAELRLAYPAGAACVLQNLINSHDTDRLASMAHNPDREYDRQNRVQDNNPDYDNTKPAPAAYARARLAALLQMTYVGAPLIYYGDEVGMWGADDPSNRKPMLWQDLQPYDQPAENAVLVEQLEFYRQALALHNTHSALRIGSFKTLLTDDEADVWAFLRSDAGEHVLVVLNASELPREVRIPLPADAPASWRTVLGEGGEQAATNGQLTIQVPAIAGVVLEAQGS
ncbi:MAG: alpha-amylase family glycosyl hydrolase [Planctomycetota bacterium]